jgi:hypothetical protein
MSTQESDKLLDAHPPGAKPPNRPAQIVAIRPCRIIAGRMNYCHEHKALRINTALVVEVADTSLGKDCCEKLMACARGGFQSTEL